MVQPLLRSITLTRADRKHDHESERSVEGAKKPIHAAATECHRNLYTASRHVDAQWTTAVVLHPEGNARHVLEECSNSIWQTAREAAATSGMYVPYLDEILDPVVQLLSRDSHMVLCSYCTLGKYLDTLFFERARNQSLLLTNFLPLLSFSARGPHYREHRHTVCPDMKRSKVFGTLYFPDSTSTNPLLSMKL